MPVKIIAFDQATIRSGYAVGLDGVVSPGKYGVLVAHPKKDRTQAERRRIMKELIREMVHRERPSAVAFEGVFLGQNVSTLIDLAEFRGQCIGAIEDMGIPVIDVSSPEVLEYLHLKVGTPRKHKKERAQFVATADVLGRVYASDNKNPLISEDAADAVILLRIAEAKYRLEHLTAMAATAEDFRSVLAD